MDDGSGVVFPAGNHNYHLIVSPRSRLDNGELE